MSPTSYYYLYRGRWISPYERKIRGWEEIGFSFILSYLLKSYLTEGFMKDLVYMDNPFIKMIDKDTKWEGATIPIPIIYETNSKAADAKG